MEMKKHCISLLIRLCNLMKYVQVFWLYIQAIMQNYCQFTLLNEREFSFMDRTTDIYQEIMKK